jgi:hypothetical protein
MDVKLCEPPTGPATRRAIQEYCSRNGLPVSIRTIETWDLPYRVIGNKAVSEWSMVLAYLHERFSKAPLHNSAVAERLRARIAESRQLGAGRAA